MHKKIVKTAAAAVLFLVLPVTAIFAQRIALAVDTFPLFQGIIATDDDADFSAFGIGATFEFLLGSNYSVGVRFDFFNGKQDKVSTDTYINFGAHGRVYLMNSGLGKFFLDFGIGFDNCKTVPDAAGAEDKTTTGLTWSVKAGWKQLLAPKVFMEASLGYGIGKDHQSAEKGGSNNGWKPGLALGLQV